MSNEFKEWLHDKFCDVLLIDSALDKITNIDTGDNWTAVISGTKDNIHRKYKIWFNEDDGWHYKLII